MRQAFVLPAILVLAFGLRIAGLSFGLPYVYHQDEAIVVNHAMAVGAEGWNTKTYLPPQFASYFLFIFYGAYFALGRVFGLFSGTEAFALHFLKDPTPFYFIGRFVLGVVFGTATVALLFRLGTRFFSRSTGGWASMFLAVCFMHVAHSHYVYMDAAVTFAVLLLFYFLFRGMEEPGWKNALRAGAAFGWAVSVKYTAVYFFYVMAAPIFIAPRKKGTTAAVRLLGAGLLSVAVYAAVSPYSFLDWHNFIAQVRSQSAARGQQELLHHLLYSLNNGTSPLFLMTALLGSVVCGRHWGRPKTAVIFLGVFVYYAVNTAFSQPFARYMMPLLPFLCLFAAEGISFWKQKGVGAALGAVLALNLVSPTLYFDRLLATRDTRTEALAWFEAHVPEKSVVVLDNVFFGPRLTQTREQIEEKYGYLGASGRGSAREKRLDLTMKTLEGKKTYKVYYAQAPEQDPSAAFLFGRPLVKPDAENLRAIGAEYVVLNYADPSPELRAWKASDNGFELAASFNPYHRPTTVSHGELEGLTGPPDSRRDLFSRKTLGPYLEIYKVKR